MFDKKKLNTNAVNMLYQDLTSSLRVQVAENFPSKADAAYPYSEVLHKSFLFYYQQRSGKLPHQVGAGQVLSNLKTCWPSPSRSWPGESWSTGMATPRQAANRGLTLCPYEALCAMP